MRTLVAALLALAVAPVAQAGNASLVTRELPASGRSLASVQAPSRFDLVGLHWRGPGHVAFRTRSVSGRWSAWREAAPEGDGGTRAGWRLGDPYWVGPSDRIAWRAEGRVTRVRAHFVSSPTVAVPPRTLSLAASPAIVPRLSWGANESIRRGRTDYAPAVRLAIVHHTAGSNSYSRAQSSAVVRAIQAYHVKGNGWNDIGYNLLVDKYGQVFEGRYGGLERNVVGAHAEGFNIGSFGVAVIGNYSGARLAEAARAALVKAIVWRLDVAHVDPLSTLSFRSGGNPRFPRGAPVFLRAVAGHRDTGFTDCPGGLVYAQLASIARDVSETGLPKIYTPAPVVQGTLGGPVRFSARASGAVPWTVTVTDSIGNAVATGRGRGPAISWTWDSRNAPAGGYAWRIDAGTGARAVTGTLGKGATPVPPLLSGVAADPLTVTPKVDGSEGSTTVSYKLGAPALLTATLLDANGVGLTMLFSEQKQAGAGSFTFTPSGVQPGRYRVALEARTPVGRVATATVDLVVDRTFWGFTAAPLLFSPNGDGKLESVSLSFVLQAAAQVQLAIVRGRQPVATLHAGELQPGFRQYTWDGNGFAGRVADGRYDAVLTATHAAGTVSQTLALTVDTRAPKLELVSLPQLRFRLDEAATVLIDVDEKRIVKVHEGGEFTVPYAGTPRRVSAVAYDAAGNVSRRVTAAR